MNYYDVYYFCGENMDRTCYVNEAGDEVDPANGNIIVDSHCNWEIDL